MAAQDAVAVFRDHALEVEFAEFRLHGAHCHADGARALVVAQAVEQRVDVHCLGLGALHGCCGVVARERQRVVVALLRSVVELPAYAVVDVVERVLVVENLLQSLAAGIVREERGIGHVEVAVVVEHELLCGERLALIGHRRRAAELLGLHVLEPLAAPERQQQVLLVGRRLQHARVGQDNLLVLVAARHTVDHDAVQMARLHVLLLHVDVAAGDAVVEDALGNLQFGTLLLHREQQLAHLHVGVGAHVVLEVERSERDDDGHDDERAHGLHERDAGGLDGGELAALAEVAERDERRQQQGQRQRLGHEHQTHVPEELRHDLHRDALTDELVDVAP